MASAVPAQPLHQGIPWNDGEHRAVRRIRLYVSDDRINGIQIKYDNGWGPIHGSSASAQIIPIELAKWGEYLTSLSGFRQGKIVRSIKFVSSTCATYGPYGQELGEEYGDDGEIVGFYGVAGNPSGDVGVGTADLQSIRAHVKRAG